MRRALLALLMVASTLGLAVLPASAEVSTGDVTKIHLSFDFSDNSDPASASGGPFNIITDVLPEHSPGVVRMVAVAPANSGQPNLVCRYQVITTSQVECGFNFTASGTWAIRAQYAVTRSSDVSATAITNIDVSD
ncbi:MAG: hypothetical protein ACHQFZ_03510 [Acidimicrobiales bacterium]